MDVTSTILGTKSEGTN